MESLDTFMEKSSFSAAFAEAVRSGLGLLEAQNINKDFLKREADSTGDPNRFQVSKHRVQLLWAQEDMTTQIGEKNAQKVLNFLYLMEIRQPGFVTEDRLHAIHDLFIHNLLDTKFLSKVNSDTLPNQAAELLSQAVEHKVQSDKPYPNLTPEEETIWNRVKVYHEFPDGFKWVYAVNENGAISSYMPSYITAKTMHHCGNTPDRNSDNQYWELRDAKGKAYLTVILSPDGKIEESKSWGNQPNKYRKLIQPYVKWLLKNKVTGVGHRYDYGYATHNNFGVKDFMGDDPEFIEYVSENKPELFGNTEKRILFWQGAVQEGVLTVDDLKRIYKNGWSIDQVLNNFTGMPTYKNASKFSNWGEERRYYGSSSNAFGQNPFDVICAACGECPFNEDELKELIASRKISLEEFANYDIHLLTPEMQKAFVRTEPYNLERLMNIAAEVASFEVDPEIIEPLIDNVIAGRPMKPDGLDPYRDYENPRVQEYNRKASVYEHSLSQVLEYIVNTNPPDKAKPIAEQILGNDRVASGIFNGLTVGMSGGRFGGSTYILNKILQAYGRFPDIQLPENATEYLKHLLFSEDGATRNNEIVMNVLALGRDRIARLFEGRSAKEVANLCLDTSRHLKLDARNLLTSVHNLAEVTKIVPELEGMEKNLRPSLKLAYYCVAPDNHVDRAVAVSMALKQIEKGENIPSNKNAMLSAMGAATMMAIGKFPEIMEHVTPIQVCNYVFPQAAMIEHTYSRDTSYLSKNLASILKEGYMSADLETRRNDWSIFSCTLVFVELERAGALDAGDPIFTELYFDSTSQSATELLCPPYQSWRKFYVNIPVEGWPAAAERKGKKQFVDTYIVPAMSSNGKVNDQEYVDYVVDYLLSAEQGSDITYVTRSKAFRRRPILNAVKKGLADAIKSGKKVSVEIADTLNKQGLLNKEFLDTEMVRQFNETPVDDMDITDSTVNGMINETQLKKYMKSPNFPEYIVAIYRVILDSYDSIYSNTRMWTDAARAYAETTLFKRFYNLTDFMLRNAKNKYVVAAAKLMRQNGILDAFRIVANRYGEHNKLHLTDSARYGFNAPYWWDNSKDWSVEFKDLVTKLDILAETKQKYVPSKDEPELKLK